MSMSRVDDTQFVAAVEWAAEWIRRTRLLQPDGALERLRPDAVLEIESRVEEFVAMGDPAQDHRIAPRVDVSQFAYDEYYVAPTFAPQRVEPRQWGPVKTRMVTEFAEFMKLAPDESRRHRRLVSVINAATNMRDRILVALDASTRWRLYEKLLDAIEANPPPKSLHNRLVPAYLLALYHGMHTQMNASAPSPFAPLLAIWEAGAWPMLLSDEEMAVYVPQGEIQKIEWDDATIASPFVQSALTYLTSPLSAATTTITMGTADRICGTALIQGEVSIGSAGNNTLTLTGGTGIAPRHARLIARNGQWWISDLQTSDGTYVRSRRVTTPTAVRGLDIQVGSAILRIPKTDFTANQLGLFMGVDTGPARESDVTLVGLDPRSHRLCTLLQVIPTWMLVNLAG